MKRWKRAVALVVLDNRQKKKVKDEWTSLDPEVLQKLLARDPQFIGEFQEYRYGDRRREHLATVSDDDAIPNLHGKHLYVLSTNHQLYVQPEPAGVGGARIDEFRHSAFLAGGPVLSAGQMFIWDGDLVLIDNSSGHYKPRPHTMIHVLRWLKIKGISLESSLVTVMAEHGIGSYLACDYLRDGAKAKALAPEELPDVESVFGFVAKHPHQQYGSFRDAAMAMLEERRVLQQRGKERRLEQRAKAEQLRRQRAEKEKAAREARAQKEEEIRQRQKERDANRKRDLQKVMRGPPNDDASTNS